MIGVPVSLKNPSTGARLLLCHALGLIGSYAMGPLFLWPALLISHSLYWITLTSFAENKKRISYAAGFLFGLGFFGGSLWWIGNALLVGGSPFKWVYPLALIGLPTILSIYPALVAGITRTWFAGRSLKSFLAFIVISFLAEYGRGILFTGFPWNLSGMAWTKNIEILQFLSIGGIYGLTALSIYLFAIAGFIWKGTAPKSLRTTLMFLAFIIYCGLYGYGATRLQSHSTQYHDNIVVQMIQPNIAQEDKWDGNKQWENYRDLIKLMHEDIYSHYATKPTKRIIVMPETAVTYHELSHPQAREALLGRLSGYSEPNVYLLTGALLRDDAGYHNSLIAMDRSGNLLQKFDKFHLVPFGEYIPLNDYIPIAPIVNFEGMVQGDGPKTLSLPDAPSFSPLVCYEVIFPGHVTHKQGKRPDWLVNVTNDAWYGISPGPIQHLAQAQYRAIEEGLPMVRVANTGVSAIFDAYGRPLETTPLFVGIAPEHLLPKPAEPTFYSKFF